MAACLGGDHNADHGLGVDPVLTRLPANFWTVHYVGVRFPDSPAVAKRPGIADGANCQLFAYEVLKHFGLDMSSLRSSELWADTEFTARV
jgi:hypothetical protein